jgi:phosphoserine aminotransferase
MAANQRAYNFCAGPATIPEVVLARAREELFNWKGKGTSVMEISHRSTDFIENVLEPARENLKKLLKVPDDYDILFITAGTSHQFSMVPLNLLDLKLHNAADYFYTGTWSGKAINEAKRYGEINIALSTEGSNFREINSPDEYRLNPKASYIHYTPNETIHGFQFHTIPESKGVPLVADMSSEILSCPIDISKFGMIYAGTQKNIGPSGLTLVIIRKDMAGYAKSFTPVLYNYQTYIESGSLYHTPNTFGIYMAGCVFEWLLSLGGLSEVAQMNQRKSQKLYNFIDASSFYHNPVQKEYRSQMNVIYYLPTVELEQLFVKEAQNHQLINLKGHKSIGGVRASIYNAMPEKGVEILIEFMREFEKKYG